ncbi:uncharacterized protein LOC144924785 [Branchiostoma floridae x Branchiostoma belcheri]
MGRYLCLLVFVTLFQNSLQSGCQTVRISGATRYQTSRMTTYTMTGRTHDGRPVYQSSRGDYLYYDSSDTTWNVGPTVGSTSVGMYLRGDTSYYADDTSGIWYLTTDVNSFQADSRVSVSCYTGIVLGTSSLELSTGAIIGIVFGVLAAVVLIVLSVCKKTGGASPVTPV